MAKKLLPIILLLLFANIVLADSIVTEVVNDQISPYDSATYRITIFNEKNVSDKYVIVARDVGWSIQTEPLTDYTTGIKIPQYSNYTVILLAKPREERPFVFSRKSFQVDFTSEVTGRAQTAVLSADVRQDLIKSPFDIEANLFMPDVFSPLQANSVKIVLKNRNLLNITNLAIDLKSNFFEKTATVDLLPEQEKIVEFSVSLEPGLPPQQDSATLTISRLNNTVKTIKKDYSIGAYGNFKTEKTVEENFLKKTTTIKYTNEGNAELSEAIFIETTLTERIFTSTSPKTLVTKINNIPYYTANLTLNPRESATVVVRTDYMPLIYILIILIALAVLYFTFRAPIIAAKEAKDIAVEEGGIKEVSISVKVKNRSARPVENIKVTDRIPSIAVAELRKSDALRPEKTFHYPGGIVLQYNLHKMEPGEVRFITYRLKTRLKVVGDLRLKPAIVQYDSGKKTSPNPVDVYSP